MAAMNAKDLAPFSGVVEGVRRQAKDQGRASMVVHVATLSLLIDAGIINTEAAVQRIEETRRKFPEVFDREGVTVCVQWAIDLLRGEVPLHGSVIEQQMQRQARRPRMTSDRSDA
jgi:hypothetical protein